LQAIRPVQKAQAVILHSVLRACAMTAFFNQETEFKMFLDFEAPLEKPWKSIT